jgi:phosphatidylserine/phosphatidylglycerophosphate/cardiolipin synthase-like enzyme
MRRVMPTDLTGLRTLADQTLSRTSGAPLIGGNHVRVLRDAAENYPAWEAALGAAQRTIHIEMYIFHADPVGRRYVDLLARKAREGVAVRVIYDWFGCGFSALRGLFGPLLRAGGEVRVFNPPTLHNTLGWIRRDHRKLITVDGTVAFVSGLCIGQPWEGRPDRGQDPWRDTGVEIVGPAVAHAEASFAESWAMAGGTPMEAPPAETPAPPPGEGVNLRLIPTAPFTANILRLDLLIASVARRRLWITDAYFIATGPYLEALKRATRDGVDVRLLLPHGSDVGWTVPVSRSLYRPLLEAGIRIFEWGGTMVHAKSAVADSRWSRVGSTNLNVNSWLGNWEMDVAIEDEGVARTLEGHYEEDLAHSTEIVLKRYQSRFPFPREKTRATPEGPAPDGRHRTSRRVVRTVTGVGRSLGAAVTGNRPLEDFEVFPVGLAALVLATLAGIGFIAPRVIAWPVAALAAWTAVTFLVEAWSMWRR